MKSTASNAAASENGRPVKHRASVRPPARSRRVEPRVPAPRQSRGDAVKILALLQAENVRPERLDLLDDAH